MTGYRGPNRSDMAVGRPLRDASKRPLLRVRVLVGARLTLRSELASVSKGLVHRMKQIPVFGRNTVREG